LTTSESVPQPPSNVMPLTISMFRTPGKTLTSSSPQPPLISRSIDEFQPSIVNVSSPSPPLSVSESSVLIQCVNSISPLSSTSIEGWIPLLFNRMTK
jgi:hypothetical protein